MPAISRAMLLGALTSAGCGAAEGSAALSAPGPGSSERDPAELARAPQVAQGDRSATSCPASLLHGEQQREARASRFVYAANQNSHDVSAYSVEPSGALTALGAPVRVGQYPQNLALLPNGKTLFVANRGSGTVSILSVDETSGRLRAHGPEVADAGSSPVAIAVHPSGRLVFVGSDDSSFGAKNTVTAYAVAAGGSLTRVSAGETNSVGLLAMTLDASGKFLYTANALGDSVTAFHVDPCRGALEPLGQFATAEFPVALSVGHSGELLYVASSGGEPAVQTFAIEAETGVLRLVQTLKTALPAWSLRAMRLDAAGESLVVLSLGGRGSAFISSFPLNANTGAPTRGLVSPLAAGDNASEIALGPAGRFAYVGNFGSNDVAAYALDAAHGAVKHLGSVAAGTAPSALAIATGPRLAGSPTAALQ